MCHLACKSNAGSCSLQAHTFHPSAPRLRRGIILRARSVPQTVAMLPIRKMSNRRPVSLMTRLQADFQVSGGGVHHPCSLVSTQSEVRGSAILLGRAAAAPLSPNVS